ncbi:hypothetical protein [Celeribacter sp.]|uniref:hypothetical protein n=1 Tax=Celeribacter sp. TaxID=1890673 RepID=UPI003A922BBE
MRYQGGRHRGAVRYSAGVDQKYTTICNRDDCRQRDGVFSVAFFVSYSLQNFHNDLTEYRFKPNTMEHFFRSISDLESSARGTMRNGTKTITVHPCCLDILKMTALQTRDLNDPPHRPTTH